MTTKIKDANDLIKLVPTGNITPFLDNFGTPIPNIQGYFSTALMAAKEFGRQHKTEIDWDLSHSPSHEFELLSDIVVKASRK